MSNLLYTGILSANDVITLGITHNMHNNNVNNSAYALPMVLYSLQIPLFVKSLENTNSILISNQLWDSGSDVAICLYSQFYLKEELSMKQKIGVGLAFVAMYLMKSKD